MKSRCRDELRREGKRTLQQALHRKAVVPEDKEKDAAPEGEIGSYRGILPLLLLARGNKYPFSRFS